MFKFVDFIENRMKIWKSHEICNAFCENQRKCNDSAHEKSQRHHQIASKMNHIRIFQCYLFDMKTRQLPFCRYTKDGKQWSEKVRKTRNILYFDQNFTIFIDFEKAPVASLPLRKTIQKIQKNMKNTDFWNNFSCSRKSACAQRCILTLCRCIGPRLSLTCVRW